MVLVVVLVGVLVVGLTMVVVFVRLVAPNIVGGPLTIIP